ncbi:WD40/YVTN/BNR-like repeat-containing protein [Zhongshania marina]|uniref:Photosynthesis system II assembly factor Ycf48/Hcf136-like domain-containing protein n=1 Tax=Zhongshania marina TaxID=2304603 RepID=A0A2S4HKF2_9GAMM|nr:YCF48-related protein [Marortus luteolus]POP54474.1 hypothetical protein C0068_01425 [Marortus luteolus]
MKYLPTSYLLRGLLFLPLLTMSCLVSASELIQVHGGTQHEAIFDVTQFEGSIVAVGSSGTILLSNDAGKNWKRSATNIQDSLLGVTYIDSHIVAVGQAGTVLVSHDSGSSWSSIEPITNERLLDVAMRSDGMIVAVGAFGTILKSNDYGDTWDQMVIDWASITPSGFAPHIYSVRLLQSNIVIAGESGLIAKWSFETNEWIALHNGNVETQTDDASIFAMEINEQLNGFFVGQDGFLLRTTDGGKSWMRFNNLDTNELFLNIVAKRKNILITTIYGVLLSTNSGKTWRRMAPDTMDTLWISGAVLLDNDNAVILSGKNGNIYRMPI